MSLVRKERCHLRGGITSSCLSPYFLLISSPLTRVSYPGWHDNRLTPLSDPKAITTSSTNTALLTPKLASAAVLNPTVSSVHWQGGWHIKGWGTQAVWAQGDQKPGEPKGRSNQSQGLKMGKMGIQAEPRTGREGPPGEVQGKLGSGSFNIRCCNKAEQWWGPRYSRHKASPDTVPLQLCPFKG